MIVLGAGKTATSVLQRFPDAVHVPAVDHLPSGHDCIMKSPGIPLSHPLLQEARGMRIITDIDLFQPKARVIGVTGTNGKSTVVCMIEHMLKTAGIPAMAGGNLGTPVLDLPELPFHGYYVIELSSYHLEVAPSLPLEMACLLNITPDHLAHHGSWEAYVEAKGNIFRYAATGLASQGTKVPEWADVQFVEPDNAAMVRAVGARLGLACHVVEESLQTYVPLPHRCEYVGSHGYWRFVNDSKATNIEATIRALTTIEGPVYLILGGQPKEPDFTRLLPYLDRVVGIFAIGEAAPLIAAQLPHVTNVHTLSQVFAALPKLTSVATLLLSPACASLDQFENFEERGKYFKELCKKLT